MRIKIIAIVSVMVISVFALSLSVSADTERVVFADWNRWQMVLTWYDEHGGTRSDYLGQNNIVVERINDNFSKVTNGIPYVSYAGDGISGISAYSLSTPLSSGGIQYIVPSQFCERDIHLTVNLRPFGSGTSISYDRIALDLSKYDFAFFTDVHSSSDYTALFCKDYSVKLSSFSGESDHFNLSFDLTFNFPLGTILYGFFFKVKGTFNWNLVDGSTRADHGQTWFLSDLVLSDSVAGNNIYNSFDDSKANELESKEGQLLSEASALAAESKDVIIQPGLLDNAPQLLSTMQGFILLFDDWVDSWLPIKIIIVTSAGIGAIAFLFGLGHFVASRSHSKDGKSSGRDPGFDSLKDTARSGGKPI